MPVRGVCFRRFRRGTGILPPASVRPWRSGPALPARCDLAPLVRFSLAAAFWGAFAAWYVQVLTAFMLTVWLLFIAVREAASGLPALLLRAWQWPPV